MHRRHCTKTQRTVSAIAVTLKCNRTNKTQKRFAQSDNDEAHSNTSTTKNNSNSYGQCACACAYPIAPSPANAAGSPAASSGWPANSTTNKNNGRYCENGQKRIAGVAKTDTRSREHSYGTQVKRWPGFWVLCRTSLPKNDAARKLPTLSQKKNTETNCKHTTTSMARKHTFSLLCSR